MRHKQPFVMHADEPAVLLGEDKGANPVGLSSPASPGCRPPPSRITRLAED
jgi:hypothetical protein